MSDLAYATLLRVLDNAQPGDLWCVDNWRDRLRSPSSPGPRRSPPSSAPQTTATSTSSSSTSAAGAASSSPSP